MSGLIEWVIFLALSAVAIVTAAGMIITMSMYRAGLALMASFVALAGLFILLNADLLAAIQVMMNVGGMLVMMLFMVMMMMDPGGEMMWGMKRDMHMPGPGAFSMHMPRGKPPEDDQPEQQAQVKDWTCPMHPEVSESTAGSCPKCGMTLISRAEAMGEQTHTDQADGQMMARGQMGQMEHGTPTMDHDMNMGGMSISPRQNYDIMIDMAMSTAQLPWAIVFGIISALLLSVLVIFTPWPLANIQPTQDATNAVGQLLLSRYMIGFEGAAFLILAGIAGAVLLGKRERLSATAKGEQSPEAEASKTDTMGTKDTQIYTCPMHPEVRQNGQGKCPKCGMNLMPADTTASESSHVMHGGHS